MTLSASEREELEVLRASAGRFMTNQLDRGCYDLEVILDRQQLGPVIKLIIKVLLLMRLELRK